MKIQPSKTRVQIIYSLKKHFTGQCFLTFLHYFTLLSNKITRFTPNPLNMVVNLPLIENTKLRNIEFRMIYLNLFRLQFMVQ